MGLSFCLTLHNRAHLLKVNFDELVKYLPVPYPFEIIIADDSSKDNLEEVLREYTLKGLPIIHLKYSRLHPNATPAINCPAFGINLAIKQATYDAILKCDPEILWCCNPFTYVPSLFHPDRVIFGSIVESTLTFKDNLLNNKYKDFTVDKLYEEAIKTGGWERISLKSRQPYYFISLFSKRRFITIGGVDEDFMNGFAGEDDDWAERILLSGAELGWTNLIKGIHIYHRDDVNLDPYHQSPLHFKNINLLNKKRDYRRRTKDWVANKNREWGDPKAIISSSDWGITECREY